eukprot:gene31382-37933_t
MRISALVSCSTLLKICTRRVGERINARQTHFNVNLITLRLINYDTSKTDVELQKDSESNWEKLKLLPHLVSLEGVKEQDRLFHEGIVPGIFWAGVLMSSLYNPLLIKYGFDVYDFADGARNAIPRLIKTLYSHEMAKMRAGLEVASPETLCFLQNTLSPCHYLYAAKYPPESLKHTIVTDVQISRLFIDRVETGIINSGWAKRIKMLHSLAKLQLHSAYTQYAMCKMKLGNHVDPVENLEIDPEVAKNDFYPLGSVVAVVHLHTVYQQSYFTVPHDAKDIPEQGEKIETASKAVRWVLEAVISGHTEWKWIVRSYSMSKETASLLP